MAETSVEKEVLATQTPQAAPPARVAGNTGALIFGQAIQFPVSFVASIFMVRSLGSDGYGTIAFVYAFMGLFDWLASFGVEQVVVREASAAEGRTDSEKRALSFGGELWGSGMALTAATSAVAALLAAVLAFVLGYRGSVALLLVIAGIEAIALVPPRLLSTVLQVRLQMWKAVGITSARHLGWLVAVMIMAKAHAPLWAFVGIRSTLAACESMTIAAVSLRELGSRLTFAATRATELAKNSWPLALMYLAIGVYFRIDRVIIERFVGPKELGFYAVADNIGGMISVIPLAFSRSVYPEICKRLASEERFRSAVRTSFRVTIFVMGILVVAMFALGPPAIRFIYGGEFSSSGHLLRILLLAQLGAAYGTILGVVLLAQSLQRAMMVATAASAVVNVLINLFAIPRWGATGAAWATVLSYWFSSAVMFELTRRTRELNRLGLAVFARAVPGLALGLLSALLIVNPVFSAIAAPLLCATFFVLTGLISRSDWELVRSMFPWKNTGVPPPSRRGTTNG